MATQQRQDTRTKAQGKNLHADMPAQELEAQNRYWREHFQAEPYYRQGQRFEEYEPAYRLGMQAHRQFEDKQFSDVEAQLRQQYEAQPEHPLDWQQARQAAHAAWDRCEQQLTGRQNANPAMRN